MSEVGDIVRAARNGARIVNARPRSRGFDNTSVVAIAQKTADEIAIERWLAEHKPKKLRKARANAPPITKIRQAIRRGETLIVRRSGGRDIAYGPQPQQGSDSKAAGEHLRAAARSRRRRRSAQKRPA